MHFQHSAITLSRAAILGTSVALSAASIATAEAPEYTLTLGALSEDFIGRSQQYATLGFNGLALSGAFEHGRLSASATLGQPIYGDADVLLNYDISLALGNGDWQIGVGKVDRNWSPSQYSSLIMGQNAPAFHSAYLRKSEASEIDLPVLRWLGAWDGEFFVGTTEDAGQPSNALIMGMRARVRPIENLEIDFVRTAQWGGTGQPNDLETFINILAGRTNSGVASGANQMAGVGISYTLPNLADGTRIYYQTIGEDEAGGGPSCLMHMGGVEVNLPLFGVPSQVTLEHTDTRIARTTSGFCGANTAYNNNTYSYAQNGVVIGSAIDSQSVSTALYVKHQFDDMSVDWSIGHYLINDQNRAAHRLSSTSAEGFVVSAAVSREMLGGTLSALIAHQGFDLNTAGFGSGTRVGVSFQKTF
ncbi:capsule assembly Wzi family protein [Cognatishimia sp. SS12]|uniref:capsule assembly Wzi family protein n=1 Tax=Cognatishimia sp. SS12 TaxID=2979465 RepID=UPI00232B5D82|nr:capsule assembly Wzi family protein [Cognatishimia sp. SS12]MDC0739698.1 capsule assembly Wzi family protein [Cognatishimia sp. SS12]